MPTLAVGMLRYTRRGAHGHGSPKGISPISDLQVSTSRGALVPKLDLSPFVHLRNPQAYKDLRTIATTFLESPPGSYEQENGFAQRKLFFHNNFGQDKRPPQETPRGRFLVYGEKITAHAFTAPLRRLCGTPSPRGASRGLGGMPSRRAAPGGHDVGEACRPPASPSDGMPHGRRLASESARVAFGYFLANPGETST